MVNIKINQQSISVPEETTIMEAAKQAGVDIPHLCYLKEINEIGACRLCCVEVEGEERLVPACDNIVQEGMSIITNSARVKTACRTNLELIMSQHDSHCTSCVRNRNCQLQTLAKEFNLLEDQFQKDVPKGKQIQWNQDFPLIRDTRKCVKCMRCIQICDKIQSLHIWDVVGTGSRTRVDVSGNQTIEQADCSLCGQCIVHCPVGALRERDDTRRAMEAIEDPEITTVVQIAPAIRTAWGEAFGMAPEKATVNRLAGALKQMGVDYVFDTSFSADLTIMEEAAELLNRLECGKLLTYPMFTSCCPGWVSFLKSQYPSLIPQLSSAKSPQQMFGAVTKSYFAQQKGLDPKKVCCLSLMPCVAKKGECEQKEMVNKEGIKDVDIVLTTREIVRMLRLERMHPEQIEERPFDSILGDYTGAGVIFGTTGGVMEAALRTAYYMLTGQNPTVDTFEKRYEQHSSQPWMEATVNLPDQTLKVATTSGLGNARKLCEAIIRKEVSYDFVEVMACPGGCVGGGGQPIHMDDQPRAERRGSVLHRIDEKMSIRFSHENRDVDKLYKAKLMQPLSEVSKELLHVSYEVEEVNDKKE